MSASASDHLGAARRHEDAAARHDHLAEFWYENGDTARGALQREMAAHARRGAELERQWADLVERDAQRKPTPPPGPALRS